MTDETLGGPPADAAPNAAQGPMSDPVEQGDALVFDSTLKPASFLGLSFKNGLLSIITLTLYRFWGKTEVRRRVWQGLRLNGDAFEYTGRGKELFIGFLLALVVLGLPFLLVVFVIQFLGPMYMGLVILPLYIFMFWLWGFGVFTAFRYLASRTTWRGIRFRLGGSATGYGFYYIGAVLLSGITLGWYWPTAERSLAERLWGELRFGDRRVRFSMGKAKAEGVYGPFALGWLLTLTPYLLVFTILGMIAAMNAPMMGMVEVPPPAPVPAPVPPMPDMAAMMLGYMIAFAIAPLLMLIWAPYQAAMMRSIAAGVSIDGATFKLEVKAIPLWWMTLSNLVVLLFTLGFLMPWVQARTANWLVKRLKSTGTARLDLAGQTGTGPKTGEGLADAFGFSLI
jgi:uncharacterized membrane protein YjgN (DUF898 family)